MIYTTNAIESLHMQLRKVLKNRGHFPSDESAVKLIYLALRNITKKWNRPPVTWKAAAGQFAIQFGDRFFSQLAEEKTTKPTDPKHRLSDTSNCNLVAEYDASGTLITQYINGPRVDEILAKVTSSGTTYPLEDALGSTIAVTNATRTVLERITYTDAFGPPEFEDAAGSPLPGTTTGTRFLFTGREYRKAIATCVVG